MKNLDEVEGTDSSDSEIPADSDFLTFVSHTTSTIDSYLKFNQKFLLKLQKLKKIGESIQSSSKNSANESINQMTTLINSFPVDDLPCEKSPDSTDQLSDMPNANLKEEPLNGELKQLHDVTSTHSTPESTRIKQCKIVVEKLKSTPDKVSNFKDTDEKEIDSLCRPIRFRTGIKESVLNEKRGKIGPKSKVKKMDLVEDVDMDVESGSDESLPDNKLEKLPDIDLNEAIESSTEGKESSTTEIDDDNDENFDIKKKKKSNSKSKSPRKKTYMPELVLNELLSDDEKNVKQPRRSTRHESKSSEAKSDVISLDDVYENVEEEDAQVKKKKKKDIDDEDEADDKDVSEDEESPVKKLRSRNSKRVLVDSDDSDVKSEKNVPDESNDRKTDESASDYETEEAVTSKQAKVSFHMSYTLMKNLEKNQSYSLTQRLQLICLLDLFFQCMY